MRPEDSRLPGGHDRVPGRHVRTGEIPTGPGTAQVFEGGPDLLVLDKVFRRKESRVLSTNLTIHYNRYIYLVEPSPEALKLRGKEVEVHETFDGRVLLRVEDLDLRTVPFNPEDGVRQQDIDDNKYLATTLAKIRQDQLARDEEKVTRPASSSASAVELPTQVGDR